MKVSAFEWNAAAARLVVDCDTKPVHFTKIWLRLYYPHREDRGAAQAAGRSGKTTLHCSAEFRVARKGDPVLLLVVWTLKREVRAIRGCLGMYRRRRTWHAAISVGEV